MEKNTQLFEKQGFEELKADYEKRCVTLHSRVKVVGTQTFTGIAEAIDETGALMVADESKVIHRVIYGDVSVRGVMGYV